MRIEYPQSDADRVVWAAIDQREPVDIVLRGWRVGFAKRALPLCELFFVASERPKRRPWHLLAMAVYGWAFPALIGIYNHAALAGVRPTWQQTNDELVVSFRSPSGSAT